MDFVNRLLQSPFLWNISQFIFGANAQKRKLFMGLIPNGRILDFGCANGNLFPAFYDFDYYGVDIDEKLIEDARKKYGTYKNARFVCADILKRPFPEDFFDSVLFSTSGHHIDDKTLYEIMRALERVLKTGGKLYYFDTIHEPGRDSAFLKFLLRLDRGKYMRDEKIYRSMIYRFSDSLKPLDIKVSRIS
ncbi:MAG: class I SAM-dependent methyltransferase, partial [Candidatus Omnitrophica bacterium]|nr:class I SAM-dependent methyltransferase [Candidatus Omnitrophota bacterium]